MRKQRQADLLISSSRSDLLLLYMNKTASFQSPKNQHLGPKRFEPNPDRKHVLANLCQIPPQVKPYGRNANRQFRN